MGILEAIILGAVQGLTEFLPVSSSGHLQIAKEILGVRMTDNLTFDVMLHLATVLATVVVLWREVKGLFTGLVQAAIKRQYNPQSAYVLKILLSMVPVGVVGLLMRDPLNRLLASPSILLIVGVMLLVTAVLLLLAGRAKERTSDKSEISFRDAFIIGVAQAVAAMPGLSRSGATISTGLLLGNRKVAVAHFSFLMVILPILGEALLDVVRGDWSGGVGVGAASLAAGFAAAFGVGLAACKFMIEMVKRRGLGWFAAYCAVVGVATLVYYFV